MSDLLVVDSFGYRLGKSGKKVVFRFASGEKVERSVYTFSALVLGGSGSVSIDALKLLASYNIPVVFVDSYGPFAVFHPFFMHGTVITRREQMRALSDSRGVHLAKAFVFSAIANKARLLKYFAKNRVDDENSSVLYNFSNRIESFLERIQSVSGSLDEIRTVLMGFEGEATHIYYNALTRIIPSEFGFRGRDKRPPRDPVNSLLSYGYTILNSVVTISIAKVGLEPFAGFLHVDRSGKPSLVLDLSEEFRQPIVDAVVVPLFTRGWISLDDFEWLDDGRVIINKGGKEKFFSHFNKRLASKVLISGKNTSFEGAILHQARNIARFLLRRIPRYQPFIFKWW